MPQTAEDKYEYTLAQEARGVGSEHTMSSTVHKARMTYTELVAMNKLMTLVLEIMNGWGVAQVQQLGGEEATKKLQAMLASFERIPKK